MLDGVVIDDTELFNDKLQEWEDFYNFDRPHGGLGGQTPYETTTTEDHDPGVNDHRQLHTHIGAPGRNRTCDTRFRKPVLYPLSYEGRWAEGRGHEGRGRGPGL